LSVALPGAGSILFGSGGDVGICHGRRIGRQPELHHVRRGTMHKSEHAVLPEPA
jgi:hypothetical protein